MKIRAIEQAWFAISKEEKGSMSPVQPISIPKTMKISSMGIPDLSDKALNNTLTSIMAAITMRTLITITLLYMKFAGLCAVISQQKTV